MAVFRVSVAGNNLRMLVDGKEQVCGFYKNEYVRASSSTAAEEIAKERVRQAVLRNPAIKCEHAERVLMRVDEIESGQGVWKLLRDEGFVFYIEGGDDHEEEDGVSETKQ